MDKRLQIVERLYESGADGLAEHPMGSDEQAELHREYQAMSQTKFWLDHRRPQRPDAETVDRIVDAAAKAAAGELPHGVRSDRPPLRLFRGTPLRVAIAAAVVVIAVSVGMWRTGESPIGDSERMREQVAGDIAVNKNLEAPAPPSAPAPARESLASLEKEETEGAELDEIVAGRSGALTMDSAVFNARPNEPAAIIATSEISEVPEWGHPDELVQIKQRIEQLKARQSDLGWDKPLVPLEMVPGSAGDAAIRQAGAKQQ